MATRLCCAAPSRSTSPQDASPRPLKHWTSMAAVRHPHTNEEKCLVRNDFARLSANTTSEDLELHRIFVSATLPDDHPDALHVPGRKPSLDHSIVRSPSFTKKLRRQLSRRSIASGQGSIRVPKSKPLSSSQQGIPSSDDELESLRLLELEHSDELGFDPDALSLALDEARLASLNLGRSITAAYQWENDNSDSRDVAGYHFGNHDTQRTVLLQSSCSGLRSASVPERVPMKGSRPITRKSRSISSFGGSASSGQDAFPWQLKSDLTEFDTSWESSLPDWLTVPSSHSTTMLSTVLEQPSKLSVPALVTSASVVDAKEPNPPDSSVMFDHSLLDDTASGISTLPSPRSRSGQQQQRSLSHSSEDSVHLYDMQISQHLRTQSQQSDVSSTNCPNKPRNPHLLSHLSLNSVIRSSTHTKHQRGISSISCINLGVSSTWDHSVIDASSSIYSRRLSTSEDTNQHSLHDLPYSISLTGHGPQSNPMNGRERRQYVPDSTPRRDDFQDLYAQLPLRRTQSIKWQSANEPRQDLASSLAESKSSGSLGKPSRFKEDITATLPAKSSKKTHSMLKMLFPKLSKPKFRSISTPLLVDKVGLATAMFDGPSDDRSLLAVPDQAVESQNLVRSLSSSEAIQQPNLPSPENATTVPTSGLTTHSLAEYELALSVSGDDRRRKSAIDLDLVRPVQEDGRQGSAGRPLRRAMPLGRSGGKAENILMEKALHQHRLEKAALFRVNSRRSEQPNSSFQAPVFSVPFATSTTSSPGRMPAALDDLDPLETTATARHAARRGQSMQHLHPSGDFKAGPPTSGKLPSSTWTANTLSTTETKGARRLADSIIAWSRYPSHTRTKRCGSAGLEDNILIHDFAYTVGLEGEQGTEASDVNTPSTGRHNSRLSVKKKRNWIVRSRSMTFGTVVRYYSNLFTSSAARNRRSSIAIGGKLEHPELEILPPVFPIHPYDLPHRRHSSGHFSHFVDHLKDEGHHLKEEGHHLKLETHDTFLHHTHVYHSPHRSESEEDIDPLSRQGTSKGLMRSSESDENSKTQSVKPHLPNSSRADVAALDGPAEVLKDDPFSSLPSARRLSRMYQAYVQLPNSMDVKAGVGKAVKNTNSSEPSEGINTTGTLRSLVDSEPITSGPDLLSVPAHKYGTQRSGSIVRRFPSVTVVDDRRGHWRSISLISTHSGKSLRNSTNDLLDRIKEAKNHEREKLMKEVAEDGQEVGVTV